MHAAVAAELSGQVVGITDGDTLTLLTPSRQEIRVRLAENDTPERRQPYLAVAEDRMEFFAAPVCRIRPSQTSCRPIPDPSWGGSHRPRREP